MPKSPTIQSALPPRNARNVRSKIGSACPLLELFGRVASLISPPRRRRRSPANRQEQRPRTGAPRCAGPHRHGAVEGPHIAGFNDDALALPLLRTARSGRRSWSLSLTSAAASRRASLQPNRTERACSSILSRMAWISPAAANLPRAMTRMRSAKRSTSCRMCEETMIVCPSAPSRRIRVDQVRALDRVGPVERLVHQHDWTGRGRVPRPPWCAGACPWNSPDRSVGVPTQFDQIERPRGGPVRVRQLLQNGIQAHEFEAGQERIDRLLFRHEANVTVQANVATGGLAEDTDRAGGWSQQTGQHFQRRRLAGPIRTEQGGHPRLDAKGNVGNRDDVAVPLRQVVDDDGRILRNRRRRRPYDVRWPSSRRSSDRS